MQQATQQRGQFRASLVPVDAQTGAETTCFDLASDCMYRVALPPGTCRAELRRRGIDRSKDLSLLPLTRTHTPGTAGLIDLAGSTWRDGSIRGKSIGSANGRVSRVGTS
jgi:hypothetical protein